ncbi:MAG: DUF4827 domain-containing protein [Prevotella sp.]|jgi:hypothetical protein|nr:DUF4827 domain-containing protein [Prevotella sp.]
MKKILLFMIAAIVVFASCNDYETYGDQKEKERNAINKFIADSSITVISEDVFNQNGYKTDLSRNEFVRLDKSGVYMQIVRQGCGTKLQNGETANLVCRCEEYDIMNDTTGVVTNLSYTAACPDIMRVTCTSGTFTASFTKSIAYNMYYCYSSAAVPAGWLVPLTYVNVGVPQSDDDEIAKVRLIVPHSQGHTIATQKVAPYYYELTFQREA